MKWTQNSAKKPKKTRAGQPAVLEKATLAGGCFWCVEADLEKLDGVKEAISGYAGGDVIRPSYKEVSSGETGHLEAVQILFDPQKISYSQILDAFWRTIDPTDKGGQFADRGMQYSTAIFYHNEEQKKTAQRSKKELEEKGPFKKSIATSIRSFKNFYKAEGYHQDYYKKSKLKYSFYRYRSGRDQFLKRIWGAFKDFRPFSNLKSSKGGKKQNRDFLVPGKNESSQHKSLKSKHGALAINKPLGKHSQKPRADSRVYSKPPVREIKSKLTELQYRVTQESATEPPFQNPYWDKKTAGIYVDIVSGEPLFSSLDKYDSGTGWPSFTKPLVQENIITKKDGFFRIEARSQHGDSHLGHLFSDGPPPTGLRYCVNSAALRFVPKEQLEKEGYSAFAGLFK